MRAHLLLTEDLIHRIATIPHASGKEE
jgi:hypothetical protein